MIVAEIIN